MQTKMFNLGLLGVLMLASMSANESNASSTSTGLVGQIKGNVGLVLGSAGMGAVGFYAGQQAWEHFRVKPAKAKAASTAAAKAEPK